MIQKLLRLFFVFFVLGTLSIQAQDLRVSGTVTDATDGVPLPGVNVIIKGTSTGATTDFDGRYAIMVSDANTAVLQFTFLGYTDLEITVSNNKVIDIVLQESAESLDEVVVTAFGISREKKAIGYAVTELKSDEINTVKGANVANSLVGKVAGLVVNESGGVGSGSRIILRGNGSITGNNQALIVVDGIPINAAGTESGGSVYSSTVTGGGISDVNSEDIASISVLKGPNAAALYGSRAAGGVILITTKTGNVNTGLGITINSQIVAGSAMFTPDYQNSYGQGTNGLPYPDLEDFGGGSWGGLLDGSSQLYYTGEQEPYTAQSSNVDDFFETGLQAINFLGLDQGGAGYSVRFSYTNNYTTSHIPGSTLKSNNFNLRSTVDLNDKLTLDAKGTYFDQDLDHRVSLGSEGVLAYVFAMPRNVRTSDLKHYQMDDPSIYEPGGAVNDYDVISYAGPGSSTGNPYWIQEHDIDTERRGRFFGFAKLDYEINEYFNVFARIGGDVLNISTDNVDQVGHHFFRDGRLSYGNSRNSEFNADFLGTFNKDLTEKFNLTVLFGGTLSKRTHSGMGVSGSQFKIPTRAFYANTNIQSAGHNPESIKKVNSLYGAVNMSWDNFVYLDITGRNDWSSTLDESNYSYFYPSVSLSVLVDRFIDPDKEILNLFKARLSWAQVGNDTKVYQIYQTYGVTSEGYLGLTTLNAPSVKYNVDLKPETISSSEFGIEFGLWRNRLYGDLSIYKITTTDMIYDVPVPASTGYQTFRSNIGKVENNGFEVLLGGVPIRNDNFSWDISLNFSHNNNEMVELIDGLETVTLNQTNSGNLSIRAEVGGSIGDIYGTTWATDDDGNLLVTAEGRPLPSESQVKLGNSQPDWIGGMTNNFNFYNFNLRFLIDYRFGGQIYSQTSAALDGSGVSERSLEYREDGVIIDAINTGTELANTESITSGQYWTSFASIAEPYVYDQTNIRLREFSLMYNLTSENSRKIGMTDAAFGLVGRNLFFLYKEAKDIDPETTLGTTLGGQGISSYNVPTVRSFGLSINLKF